MRARTLILLLLIAFILVGLFGYITLKPIFNKPASRDSVPDFDALVPADAVPQVTFINPFRGDKNARLTIVEYGDYLCSFCATIENTLARLILDYKGKIKIVWKDFPLTNIHPLSDDLAEAARCAGEEGKFWDYHDYAFKNQDNLLSEADLARLYKELKLGDDFATCFQTHKMRPRVQADFEEGKNLKIDGVPYFFVGSERLSGAVSYERFKEVIDAQLKLD